MTGHPNRIAAGTTTRIGKALPIVVAMTLAAGCSGAGNSGEEQPVVTVTVSRDSLPPAASDTPQTVTVTETITDQPLPAVDSSTDSSARPVPPAATETETGSLPVRPADPGQFIKRKEQDGYAYFFTNPSRSAVCEFYDGSVGASFLIACELNGWRAPYREETACGFYGKAEEEYGQVRLSWGRSDKPCMTLIQGSNIWFVEGLPGEGPEKVPVLSPGEMLSTPQGIECHTTDTTLTCTNPADGGNGFTIGDHRVDFHGSAG